VLKRWKGDFFRLCAAKKEVFRSGMKVIKIWEKLKGKWFLHKAVEVCR
jgi:hypothetical protein